MAQLKLLYQLPNHFYLSVYIIFISDEWYSSIYIVILSSFFSLILKILKFNNKNKLLIIMHRINASSVIGRFWRRRHPHDFPFYIDPIIRVNANCV